MVLTSPETTGTAESETSPETTVESETSPETTAESETTFEPIGSVENRNPVAGITGQIHVPPPVESILVPIILFGILFVAGLVLFTLIRRKRFYQKNGIRALFGVNWTNKRTAKVHNTGRKDSFCSHLPLDADEEDLLQQAVYGQNTVPMVLLMTVPSLIAIFFCGLTLLLHEHIVDVLWPNLISQPDINEAVGCFLTPAGMVYAINLGFAYEGALNKNHVYTGTITDVATIFCETIRLCSMSRASNYKRQELILAVKQQLLEVIRYFTAPCLSEDLRPENYKSKAGIRGAILTWISSNMEDQSIRKSSDATYFDTFIARKLININVDIWRTTDNMKLIFTKISFIQWVFLEVLGYIAFIGVVFIRADSPLAELSMSVLTLFSISFLLYFIADLDDPFNGVYRMDCSQLFEVLKELDDMYHQGKTSLPPVLSPKLPAPENKTIPLL